MAIALVTHASLATPGANSAVTGTCDTTGSNLLVVAVSSYALNARPAVSDSKGNTWTELTAYTNPAVDVTRHQLWYCIPSSVGGSHTFTATGTGSFCGICAAAFSGAKSSSPFDAQNGNGSNGATSLATGSVTPSEDNEVLVAGVNVNGAGTIAIDLSFTIADSNGYSAGVNFSCAIAYLIQTTAAAKNPTWSQSGASAAMAGAIATFKAAPASAAVHFLASLGVGG